MDEHAKQPRLAAVSIKLLFSGRLIHSYGLHKCRYNFPLCGITSQQTMFDYVIASLSPEFAAEIHDLILTPPAETPYDILKNSLSREQ